MLRNTSVLLFDHHGAKTCKFELDRFMNGTGCLWFVTKQQWTPQIRLTTVSWYDFVAAAVDDTVKRGDADFNCIGMYVGQPDVSLRS